MFFTRSLRAKTLLSVLIPTALGLVAVAIIALYAYELVARDAVQQRDTELARISAARLSDNLSQHSRALQSIAADEDVQSMELTRVVSALAKVSDQLDLFDAGIAVYTFKGTALWARPITPRRRGTEFPVPSEFDEVRETLRPVFSDIFHDEISGEDVILIGVPVLDDEREFRGVVAGMYTLRYSQIGAMYSEVLEFEAGHGGFAYLVDGNGRVIHHRDSYQIGGDLADTVPVTRATSGETGAVLAEDVTGETVISGFAPVPGTDWGLITQQSWESVVGPIRGYSNLLLGLLVLGGVGSGALMFFAIGRVLRPIQDLTEGAQRIAGGDFDYNILGETDDEVQALAEQFNAMASALRESYEDLERKVDDRTKELAALNTVAQTVSRSLELEAMLSAALDKALEVLDFDSGAIYLKDMATGELEMAVHRGLSEGFRRAATRGLISARAAEAGEPLILDDLSRELDVPKELVDEGYRSVASIPLFSKGDVQGVLTTASHHLRSFPRRDVDLLLSIGNQIGVAIENARFFDAEQRRAEQFRVISEMGRHITSILDVDALLEEIVRLLKETFGFYLITVGLIEGDELVFKAGAKTDWDEPQFRPPSLKVGGEGITAWVASTGEPLLAPDVSKEPRFLFLPDTAETRSELAVPLKTKSEVIGVLNVESDQSDAFDESDVVVLQSLANQAAIAIENARLFDAEQRRAEQFRVISEAGRHIISILDVDELLEDIVRLVKETFGYYLVQIGLIEGDEMVFNVGLGPTFDDPQFQPPRVKVGEEGVTAWVAASGEPLVVPDVSQEPRYLLLAGWGEIKSELAVPLKTKSGVIGVLDVESDQLNAFDESDLIVLQSLARQAAIAVENARLFDAEQRRADQFSVIGEMGRHLTSILDVDELLSEIVGSIKETLGYHLVGIALIEGDELVFRTGVGPPFADPQFQPPRIKVGGKGIAGWVADTGEPLLAPDVSQEPRWLFLPGSEETRSELAVPLKTKTETIGVLDVQSDQLDAFRESDLVVLQSLGRQAAIAIENARLFDAEQRRAEQFRVISEVGARITSLLTVDELLDETVRLVKEDLGYYLVGIGLIDGDDLVFRTGAGDLWEDPQFQPPRLRVGEEGIAGWVAGMGEPLLVPDVGQEPRFVSIPGDIETRSELAVPLKTKAEVIGVLDVESDELNAFDETDLAVLQSLANLTAIALEEARLFDAEQRRAEQFRAISEMGRHMTSILDVDQLLHEIVHLIKETLGYYLVSIGLIEGDEVAFKTGAGPRWDDPNFQPTSLKVGGEGITGLVAGTGEPLLVADVSQDPRYIPLPDTVEIRSELVVPLKTKTEVLGVLNVESDQLNAFDESDLAVLQSLANQAAIAIENARLYEQAQQVAALQERSRLARDLHDAVTQTLFSASLIGEVVPSLWERDQEEGRQLLQELRQLTRGALAEMRTLLLELRPAALAEASLDDLLRQLAEAVTGRTGVPVTVKAEGECDLPSDVHIVLYRITQEALNNVVKHAQASRVEVRLHRSVSSDEIDEEYGQRVELLVSDDGRGFDLSSIPPDRLGLGIIRERAQAVGATVKIESQPGHGTQVMVVWKG
jgi:GAF domain-containing protein/HAMP domain-containing protein/anti-sigma regulatory factor (Ser/Thr protein kinase)